GAGDTAPLDRREVLDFLHRLKEQLLAHQRELIRSTVFETGFITADSREIVTAAIEFLADFETYAEDQAGPPTRVPHSYAGKSSREMLITHRPYRWIAAVVPQNASLTLGITIIASALYAGSRVLLRPSLQCGCTGALLAELVERSEPPGSSVLIVNCLATDFLDACYTAEPVDVIHYIGSNQFALPRPARRRPDVSRDRDRAHVQPGAGRGPGERAARRQPPAPPVRRHRRGRLPGARPRGRRGARRPDGAARMVRPRALDPAGPRR